MESFPETFSFEYLDKENVENMKKSQLLKDLRQQVYELGMQAHKDNKDHFIFKLKDDVGYIVKEILLKELMEKFPCIAYKSANIPFAFVANMFVNSSSPEKSMHYEAVRLEEKAMKVALNSDTFVVGLTSHFDNKMNTYYF